MNGIIVTGAPRSGKTSCIERLLKEEKGYTVVNGDAITVSLFYVKDNKRRYNFGRTKAYDIFEKTILEYRNINVILDFHYIEPEKLLEYYKKGYKIIFFGYPNIDQNKLEKRIRHKETPNDWTNQMDDNELKILIRKGISISKRDYFFCRETGIVYIDTSYSLENGYQSFIKEIKKSK